MTITSERLDTALSVLYENADSYYSGYFTYLIERVRSAAFLQFAGYKTSINVDQLDKRLRVIHMDSLNLATVSYRLILQQNLRSDKCEYRVTTDLWRFFGSADIDLFFIKYRSIFDNIAQMITATLNQKPDHAPHSFNELLSWLDKTNNKGLLDDKYVQLVKSCDWFQYVRSIRDNIEHYAAETVVSENTESILFKVSSLGISLTHLPEKDILRNPEITDRDGFTNFELFAGIHLGYLIWFLEKLSKLIYEEFEPNELDKQCKSFHPGFQIVRTWIECATKIKDKS